MHKLKNSESSIKYTNNCENLLYWFCVQEKNQFDLIKNYVFSLKTSLLKWRPDYDSAADEYNKAGKLIKLFKTFFVISNEFSDV